MISQTCSQSDWTIGTTKIPGSVYTKTVRKCMARPSSPPSDTVSDRCMGGGAGLQDYISVVIAVRAYSTLKVHAQCTQGMCSLEL